MFLSFLTKLSWRERERERERERDREISLFQLQQISYMLKTLWIGIYNILCTTKIALVVAVAIAHDFVYLHI